MTACVPITPQLADTRIVAILRADREEHLPAAIRTLAEAGIRCLELTMTTPAPLAQIPLIPTGGVAIEQIGDAALAAVRKARAGR